MPDAQDLFGLGPSAWLLDGPFSAEPAAIDFTSGFRHSFWVTRDLPQAEFEMTYIEGSTFWLEPTRFLECRSTAQLSETISPRAERSSSSSWSSLAHLW
jgi:hypothetical protein